MASGVVLPGALSDDLSGRALDHIKDVVAGWFDDVPRGNHVRLLVKLDGGLACASAQSFENGNALDD